MKKLFVVFTLVLVAGFLIFGSSLFKSDEAKITDRIKKFTAAYNSGDLEKSIDCFDSKTRKTYQSVAGMLNGNLNMGFGSSFFGGKLGLNLNSSDLFSAGVGLMSDGYLLTVEIKKVELRGEKAAVVYADLRYSSLYGDLSEEVMFTMVKEGFNWYIKDLKNAT